MRLKLTLEYDGTHFHGWAAQPGLRTIEGVVRAPSWFGMTCGAPPSMTATQEFVVPRSMPISLPKRNLAPFSTRP